MCRVQGPRLATVEAFCQVMRVPEVEVPNLRALDAHNAEEVSRRHLECLGVPRRHRELGNFGQLSPCLVVKRGVKRWQLLDRIRQHRGCSAPRRRVRGWRRMCGLRHTFSSSASRQRRGQNTCHWLARPFRSLAGCGKSRDFGKTVMKRARNGSPGLIKSTDYEGAKGDESGWKHHRPTFSAAC